MKGHKKVSDILIDKKLSLSEKEKTWVLISGNELVWVSGLVVSDDFKLSSNTKKAFTLSNHNSI
jgi:tRNA(Ile)-lysidine synthase